MKTIIRAPPQRIAANIISSDKILTITRSNCGGINRGITAMKKNLLKSAHPDCYQFYLNLFYAFIQLLRATGHVPPVQWNSRDTGPEKSL